MVASVGVDRYRTCRVATARYLLRICRATPAIQSRTRPDATEPEISDLRKGREAREILGKSELMNRTSTALLTTVLVAILAVAACAPGRSLVRGTWPDGRPGAAAAPVVGYHVDPDNLEYRDGMSPPVDHRAEGFGDRAAEAENWLPADDGFDLDSAADFNRSGVLQPIYFDYDLSEIERDQRIVLESNAAWLRDHPDARVMIEGHCDERGTSEYNMALGDRRAKATREFLVSLGVDWDRIETVSFGEELPAEFGDNEYAWSRNRRAEFSLVSTRHP